MKEFRSGPVLNTILILFFIICHVCTANAAGDAEADKNMKNGAAREGLSGNIIENSGKIIPRQSFILYLHPDERFINGMVKEGERIKKGTPMVRLTNDRLLNQLATLKEKELALAKEGNEIELLKLKIKLAEENIEDLDKHISDERQVLGQVPEYMGESRLRDLVERKNKSESELRLFMKELSLLQAGFQSRSDFSIFLGTLTRDVEAQIDGLLIKAPFDGIVRQMNQSPERMKAGDLILELWDTKGMKVKAWVYQNQLPYVAPGRKVKIFPDFYQDSFVWGTIQSIGPSRESIENDQFPVFPVIIDIDDNTQGLVAGMAVTIRMVEPDSKETH